MQSEIAGIAVKNGVKMALCGMDVSIFMNALMHKIYGTNFHYIFQRKLHYQF